MSDIRINVKDNFCERLNREVVIECDDVKIESGEISSESKEAKLLALNLISAGMSLLNNHELYEWRNIIN